MSEYIVTYESNQSYCKEIRYEATYDAFLYNSIGNDSVSM